MDVERDNQVGEPEDPAPDAGPEVREDEGGRAFREAETAADATLSLGEPGVPPTEVDEARTGVEEEPVVSAAPLWEPPSFLPEPPRRRSGVIVVAALVAALAGGLVSYPVALRVAQREGERTIDIPSSSRTARSPAPPGSTARVVEDIRPSIAAIFTQTIRRDLFFEAVPSQGAGTGIVLDSKGHILTNSHVVRGAQEIEVVLSDGRKLAARVAGDDPASDLAVLNVDAGGLRPAPFGNSDDLRVGDRVIAVGHALALPGGPTVTEGIVSALDRSIREPNGVTLEHLIQTDAAINPGNSGGALLDSSGRVVGVNTAIAGEAQNIGFAIAITPARFVVDQLVASGKVVRPFLGVFMVDVTPEVAAQQELTVKAGALIAQVVVGSPADQAGLQPGDVIVEIDGSKVTDTDGVQKALAAKKPGDRVDLVVVRADDRLKVRATLAERDSRV